MVLVDAYSELLADVMPPAQWQALVRLNQEMGSDTVFPIPGYGQVETIKFGGDNAVMRAAAAAHPLRPMPLAVLAHGKPFALPADAQGFTSAELEGFIRAENADKVALVPNARFTVASASGHDIHQDQPELVIEAIRQVVAGVRNPDTWYDLASCCAASPAASPSAVTPCVATPASARSITYARLAGKQGASRRGTEIAVSSTRRRPLVRQLASRLRQRRVTASGAAGLGARPPRRGLGAARDPIGSPHLGVRAGARDDDVAVIRQRHRGSPAIGALGASAFGLTPLSAGGTCSAHQRWPSRSMRPREPHRPPKALR